MKKYRVEIQTQAIVDIKEAKNYYDKLSPRLGSKLIKQLREISKTLQLNPHHQIKYDNVRFLKLRSFPYSAHYTIDEKISVVYIHAVIHTASDPDKAWIWKDE